MTSNVIPLPKKVPKTRSEQCLYILKRNDGWVEYVLGEVFFEDDKAFGFSKEHISDQYSRGFCFLQLDPIRARQVDDPEVIRDVVRNKLKNIKAQLEDALIAIEKPIVTINEEDKNE